MIVVRAPLRMSFVGGGTDLPDFYKKSTGRVLSTTIDKYVYVAINRTPFIPKVSARYGFSETVDHPSELEHTRIKAALLDLGIEKGIEIASFASLPAKTGLGSSSSFSVALMKGLHAYVGKKIDPVQAAEAACRLEISLLGEPIGKQDQYAAAIGGFNIYEFQKDGTVKITPLLIDYKTRLDFEKHLMVFYTGITRSASSVLTKQKENINKKIKVLKEMAASVDTFADTLLRGDFKGVGKLLHEGWLRKKSLTSGISSNIIDTYYETGVAAGAWGGKILGAGGGGCLLLIVPLEKQAEVRRAMKKAARKEKAKDFKELNVSFVQSGADILFNDETGLNNG